MDALDLVVDERHLDRWVGIEGSVIVDEALQIAHQPHDGSRVLRRRVDGIAGVVPQRGAGQPAEARGVLLQLGLNLDHVVGGEQAGAFDVQVAEPQRLNVVPHFLGAGVAEQIGEGASAEQLVARGDDVFDRRAVLGPLQRQRVEQNALVSALAPPRFIAGSLLLDRSQNRGGHAKAPTSVLYCSTCLRRSLIRISARI